METLIYTTFVDFPDTDILGILWQAGSECEECTYYKVCHNLRYDIELQNQFYVVFTVI